MLITLGIVLDGGTITTAIVVLVVAMGARWLGIPGALKRAVSAKPLAPSPSPAPAPLGPAPATIQPSQPPMIFTPAPRVPTLEEEILSVAEKLDAEARAFRAREQAKELIARRIAASQDPLPMSDAGKADSEDEKKDE